MARPRKQGLDYFPFDLDFFNDEKVVWIAGQYGVKGELVMIRLLCAIYRNGYFAKWNASLRFSIEAQMRGQVSPSLLDAIVGGLVKCGFFDKGMFNSARILTSKGIQQRYFEIKKRAKLPDDLPYLLVDEAKKAPTLCSKNEHSAPINVAETPINVAETPVNAAIMPQSKVKESKLKENSIKEMPHQSAGEGEDLSKEFIDRLSPEQLAAKLEELGVTEAQLRQAGRQVTDEWQLNGERHASIGAAVKHFWNHIRVKINATPGLKSAPPDAGREAYEARRQREREERQAESRSYEAVRMETGKTGWEAFCARRGINPGTNAGDLAMKEARTDNPFGITLTDEK